MADASLRADSVAVLIGVPTTLEEFGDRIGSSDFLAKYGLPEDPAKQSAVLQECWDESYGPAIGVPAVFFIEALHSLGVRVCTRATLADVARLSSACSVLVVLSHWKGSEVIFQDLHPDCSLHTLVERARSCASPLAAWLLQRAGDQAPRWASFALKSRGRPVELLKEAVHLGWRGETGREAVDGRWAHPVTLAARRREELDAMLAGLLSPGNRIELFDGMHSKEEFEAAIAPGFCGFLDLTTCTSTVLGDHVSRRRGAAVRQLAFAANQDFLWHANCIATALELTLIAGMPYADARVEAERLLRFALAEEEATRNPSKQGNQGQQA